MSHDGRYVFAGDAGDVIDRATRTHVATLPALKNSRQNIEIDWQNGVPIAAWPRESNGFATSGVQSTTTTVSLTSGGNPSHYGNTLTFTASVSPASGPTGTVAFWDGAPGSSGSVNLGSSTLSGGKASFTTSRLNAAINHLYAVYSGDSKNASSQASVNQTVNPVPLMITASSPTVAYGKPLPSIQPIYKGLVNSDMAPKLAPKCNSLTLGVIGPGTYPTWCSGASDSNYVIAYDGGKLTITF